MTERKRNEDSKRGPGDRGKEKWEWSKKSTFLLNVEFIIFPDRESVEIAYFILEFIFSSNICRLNFFFVVFNFYTVLI